MNFRKLFGLPVSNKREKLLKKIEESGFPSINVYVLVEEFFEGNTDIASIGPNIYPEPPSLREFYVTLKAIQNNPKTTILLIRITDVDDCDWFFTDTIYIAGDYTLSEIKKMFNKLKPDEVETELFDGNPSNLPALNPSDKAYWVWWD